MSDSPPDWADEQADAVLGGAGFDPGTYGVLRAAVAAALRTEREACARVAAGWIEREPILPAHVALGIAAAIRARSSA